MHLNNSLHENQKTRMRAIIIPITVKGNKACPYLSHEAKGIWTEIENKIEVFSPFSLGT